MLDEECLRPGKVSDETFLNKLNQTCCTHPHFESRGCKKTQSDRTLPHDAFRLIHYAGAVSKHAPFYIMLINCLLLIYTTTQNTIFQSIDMTIFLMTLTRPVFHDINKNVLP